jgi:hypothetical protein
MATNRERSAKERGYLAAVRRFPQAELAIRRLMLNSETFCDICEELAEAEMALSIVPHTLTELSEARRSEFQELVDRLVAEVNGALKESEARALHAGQRRP